MAEKQEPLQHQDSLSTRHLRPYVRPSIRTMTSGELLEAMGPAQGLTSGGSPDDFVGGGHGHGNGHGHGHGRH